MLSEETIQAVQQAVQIEEVISDFVALKKRGQNLWACCPFHAEHTPSFSVSPTKGFYKCFGCDVSGDAITFIRAIEGIDFVEAITYLAQKYSIPIVEQSSTYSQQDMRLQNEKDSLYILMQDIQAYYANNFWQDPVGTRIAHAYLQERGVPDQWIQQFGLGYSLEAWQGLYSYAQKKGYSEELLLKSGLVVRQKERIYDRFRGRIMFPLHNVSGKVIGFAGRVMGQQGLQMPKYINSPETAIYHKGDVLYGLCQVKKNIKEAGYCFVVEGYTDLIALHVVGIYPAVATAGTALTEAQIQLISRFTKKIILLFDGDQAGVEATLRGIDKILAQGLEVKIVALPQGEDPDSYIKKVGKEAFMSYVDANLKDFIVFQAALLAKEAGQDVARKATMVKKILQSIVLVPDAVSRALFVQQASRMLQITENILLQELEEIWAKKANLENRVAKGGYSRDKVLPLAVKKGDPIPSTNVANPIEAYEQESIRLLLNYGNQKLEDGHALSVYLLQELADVPFQTPIYKEMLSIYHEEAQKKEKVDIQLFIRHREEEIQKSAINLTASPYAVSENWLLRYQIVVSKEDDNLYLTAYKNILRLKIRLVHQLIADNHKLLKDNTITEEEEDKLLQIHTALKASEIAIARQLGMVVVG